MSFQSGSINVFVVEDNPNDRNLIRRLLESTSERFHIEEAWNLDDTLVRLHAGGIDIMLLDLNLPDSRGVETFVRVRQADATLPVIIVTGADDKKTALELQQNGVQDFLLKGTFNATALIGAIRSALGKTMGGAV